MCFLYTVSFLSDDLNLLSRSFQDGCDQIVGEITALGATIPTPTSDLNNIIQGIQNVYDKAIANVKANPGSYGISTQSSLYVSSLGSSGGEKTYSFGAVTNGILIGAGGGHGLGWATVSGSGVSGRIAGYVVYGDVEPNTGCQVSIYRLTNCTGGSIKPRGNCGTCAFIIHT